MAAPQDFEFIRYDVDDPVATITLDRPDVLNAFHTPMLTEIRAAIEAGVADPAVVAVVITGAGRGFSAGLDSAQLTEAVAGRTGRPPVASADDEDAELPGLFSYFLQQPKPIIAAVNGVTAGGGFVLATMCDLRFASTNASFLSIFTKRGLIAEHGTTWTLPRLIGMGAALDVLWSSRRIEADEALRLGLVQQVVEPDELLPTVAAYVRELAANVAPQAIAETKRLAYRHAGMTIRASLVESDESTYAFSTRPDAVEGAAALVERRTPNFTRVTGGNP
jgi:enoyl-CoA hydratase/carnithine racemase